MNTKNIDYNRLAKQIKQWGCSLGFQAVGITDIDLSTYEAHFKQWLENHAEGEMNFMRRNEDKRLHPEKLMPETCRIISVSMNYFPKTNSKHIAKYALNRDYHKVMRKQLQKLANEIEKEIGPFHYHAYADSAPVLEKALAEKAGLGWIGKNCCLIHENFGSLFFLGELFTNLPLPIDQPINNHCGECKKCLEQCPTHAITKPNQLNANQCIAYLTIEHKGTIPENLRAKIGTSIFGCDVCQDICPFNQSANVKPNEMLHYNLDDKNLVELFCWSEKEFLEKTEGTVLRRIGYERWLRNIAIALGNMPTTEKIIKILLEKANHPSDLVREHVEWALNQHLKNE